MRLCMPATPSFASRVFTISRIFETFLIFANTKGSCARRALEKRDMNSLPVATTGRLADGAVVVTGVSNIIAIAVEPKMEASLPWLDPASKDDQILASVIEVMRMRPRSPVLLVTRDINLQNKAEFANMPFVEPPDPI